MSLFANLGLVLPSRPFRPLCLLSFLDPSSRVDSLLVQRILDTERGVEPERLGRDGHRVLASARAQPKTHLDGNEVEHAIACSGGLESDEEVRNNNSCTQKSSNLHFMPV
jgi:hypothetical protein